ncbi:MAG: acetyl-CoA acetyltransferase [Candidatus Binatia bacterium]|nr:acetyl-CoA acetyltransferase [Candidatus Binatia bacterium]
MSLNDRTPVLVGAGAVTQREKDPRKSMEAAALMVEAARRAASDAGSEELLSRASSIRVTNGIWDYPNPARILADQFGADSARTDLVEVGILQSTLLADAARAIADGSEDISLVVGGEAKFRSLRSMITGEAVEDTTQAPGEKPDRFLEPSKEILNPLELEFGLGMPVNQYALLESALRHAQGESVEENRRALGELYSGMSKVASGNPEAWVQEELSPEEISTPSAKNRMLAFPYTKRHNSQWNVDQAACLILCSLKVARELGLAEDRFLFPLAAAESNHMVSLVERGALDRCFGFQLAGAAALRSAGLSIEDVQRFELYSCFPVAVRSQMRELEVPSGAEVTQCGGMAYAGGPLNNFTFQGLVRMVAQLRENPGEIGLVTSVSGMLTKQGVTLWSTKAPERPFEFTDVSEEVASQMPVYEVVRDYKGPAIISAATVQFSGEAGGNAIFVCDLPDQRRTLAISSDEAVLATVQHEEVCGRPIEISGNVATFS